MLDVFHTGNSTCLRIPPNLGGSFAPVTVQHTFAIKALHHDDAGEVIANNLRWTVSTM
jgi:hypothetical protein